MLGQIIKTCCTRHRGREGWREGWREDGRERGVTHTDNFILTVSVMSGVGWYLSTCGATADQRCRPYFKFSSLYKRYFDCRDLQWVPSEVSWVRALQFVRLLLWQFNSKHFSLKLYHNQSWIGAILLDCISNGIIYGIWSIRLWHIQQNILFRRHTLYSRTLYYKNPGTMKSLSSLW